MDTWATIVVTYSKNLSLIAICKFHYAIILSSRKDILTTIYPIDLKFSAFVPFDKFCVISRAIFHMMYVLKVMK